MKERIDEYDMAKKMMSILRGGYKPLLNEFINAPNTDQTQGSVNDNPAMGDDQNNTNNQNNNQNMASA
jgi:hypothetical protein